MTAFATNQIPSNINTLEKLAAWCALGLHRINPTLSILEQENQAPTRVAQTVFFQAADGSLRLSVRLSIPIDPTYSTQGRKFWENAQDISNVVIPVSFTTN